MNCKSTGVLLTERAFTSKMDAVVDILAEKGLLVESEGAQVVNLENMN